MQTKLAPIIVLFLFTASVAAAETVMVSVRDETEIDDEQYDDISRFYLTAVEDGVMDTLFGAGHIVFNLGDYPTGESSEIQRRYTVREAARGGGASYVIQLGLVFEKKDETTLRATRVEYELWDVSNGTAVARGTKTAPFDVSAGGSSDRGSTVALIGRRVAEELLAAW